MRSSLFASVDVIEFQTTDAYSSLDLTNAIYNVSIHSRDEKLDNPTDYNNLILYYLCAESTAVSPITDIAQCKCN
jgi:hypothetical protein